MNLLEGVLVYRSRTTRQNMGSKVFNHLGPSLVRQVLYCLNWSENFFAFVLNEKYLEDRCSSSYQEKYWIALADSTVGELLFDKANLNVFRQCWIERQSSIKCLRMSKRFIPHQSIIEKIVSQLASIPSRSSVPIYEIDEIQLLEDLSESFIFTCQLFLYSQFYCVFLCTQKVSTLQNRLVCPRGVAFPFHSQKWGM